VTAASAAATLVDTPRSVAVGDLDGDGSADVVVGYGDGVSTVATGIEVLFGPDLSSSAVIDADELWANGGVEVGPPVDLDGNGTAELFVASPTATVGGVEWVGSVYLFHDPLGVSSFGEADTRWVLDEASQLSSLKVRPAGDVDGDGVDDVLVGAEQWQSSSGPVGAIWVISGSTL